MRAHRGAEANKLFISNAILPIYAYPSVQADGPMAFSPCVASTLFALMCAKGGCRCTVVYDDRLGLNAKEGSVAKVKRSGLKAQGCA